MDSQLQELLVAAYNERFPQKSFVPGESVVPVSGKVFGYEEIVNMVEASLEGWWTEGHFTNTFERKLASFLGVKFASLTNSGSSANLLAFAALTSVKLGDRQLKPGDEVIGVAAGFPTTINPIVQYGLIPVFVDVDLGTYNANIDLLKQAITPKTKAIFLAHTLGNPYHLSEIAALCKEHNLWFIEDNCDALGSLYNGKRTGTFGDIATCSFYPAHHITTGEGGAVFTNDSSLYRIINSFRDWGRDCWCEPGKDNTCNQRFCWQLGNLPYGYDHKYIYSEVGYNLKSTDIQAALGLVQLTRLPEFIVKRRKNFNLLYEGLKKYEQYFVLPQWLPEAEPSWFGFLLTVKKTSPFSRNDIIQFLNHKKIGTRNLFAGNITKQPYFVERNIPYRIHGTLENTDIIMDNTFWIGCFPGLTDEMIDYMISSIGEFIKQYP